MTKVTFCLDGMNSLHVFKGWTNPYKKSKYLWTNEGKEADLLLQGDDAINFISIELHEDSEDDLHSGKIVWGLIDNEYFPN